MASKSSENAALKFLLSMAALRTAPKTQAEIAAGSNQVSQFKEGHVIGNVCYLNPADLPAVGLPCKGVQKLDFRPGYIALIVATPLMPKGGAIYAPLSQDVLDQFDAGMRVEDFPEWKHAAGATIDAKPETERMTHAVSAQS